MFWQIHTGFHRLMFVLQLTHGQQQQLQYLPCGKKNGIVWCVLHAVENWWMRYHTQLRSKLAIWENLVFAVVVVGIRVLLWHASNLCRRCLWRWRVNRPRDIPPKQLTTLKAINNPRFHKKSHKTTLRNLFFSVAKLAIQSFRRGHWHVVGPEVHRDHGHSLCQSGATRRGRAWD